MSYINKLFSYIYYLFGNSILITFIVLILLVILFVSALVACIKLLLHLTKQVNNPLEYSFGLDYLLPFSMNLTYILLPLATNYYLNSFSLFFQWTVSISIQVFVITPLMIFWANHRNWSQVNKQLFYSWKSPLLSLYVVISLTYIYTCVCYFSLLRFARIGTENDFTYFFVFFKSPLFPCLLIFLLFSLLNIITWGMYVFSYFYFIQLYRIIQAVFNDMCYSIHLEMLSLKKYTKLMEKLYKLHFLWFNYICLNSPIHIVNSYKSYNFFRRYVHHLYYNPSYFFIFFGSCILCEIIIMHKLSFSYYIMFWLPLIALVLRTFSKFGRILFIKDVCMIDNLKDDLNNIRYPQAFWLFIEDPLTFYGFTIQASPEKFEQYSQIFNIYHNRYQIYNINVINRILKYLNNLQLRFPFSFYVFFSRVKISYYKINRVSWK